VGVPSRQPLSLSSVRDVSFEPVSATEIGTHGRTRVWRFRRAVHRYVNPVTRPIAKRLPGFAILTHLGRKTGRRYRTPINVFRRGDDYFFFLTYGSDAQWVKNVLAAGSCSIETRGRVVELGEPELITDPELRPAPPRLTSVSSSRGSRAWSSTSACAVADGYELSATRL
jgi:deazaflavin-dependent oxidoreductase (nitroreductase family)